MKEIMSEEVSEMIRTLEKANNALARIFGTQGTCASCGEPYNGEGDCPDCRCSEDCGCTLEERQG